MTTANSFLDTFLDKLTNLPTNITRCLSLIRKLDERVEQIRKTLLPQQVKFMEKIKQLQQKKATQLPHQMQAEFQDICEKQKELWRYSKEKKDIADQIAHQVNHYTAQLQAAYDTNQKNQEKLKQKSIKPSDSSKRVDVSPEKAQGLAFGSKQHPSTFAPRKNEK